MFDKSTDLLLTEPNFNYSVWSARVEHITSFLAIRTLFQYWIPNPWFLDVINKEQVLLDKLIGLSNDGQWWAASMSAGNQEWYETDWYWFNTEDPSRHDWKIIDWLKKQIIHNQTLWIQIRTDFSVKSIKFSVVIFMWFQMEKHCLIFAHLHDVDDGQLYL